MDARGVLITLGIGLAAAANAPPATAAAARVPPALPDLRLFVPTDLISIGNDPSTGDRDLRFTHITADIGRGPFELDPHYDSATGISDLHPGDLLEPAPRILAIRLSGAGGGDRGVGAPE